MMSMLSDLKEKVGTLEQVLHQVLNRMNALKQEHLSYQAKTTKIIDALAVRAVGLTRLLLSKGSVEEEELNKAFAAALTEMMDERQKEIDLQLKIVTVDREACDGDVVLVDFLGETDAGAFEGGTAFRQLIRIGNGGFVDGFDTKLVGLKAGETKTIEVKFPDEYQVKELSGKVAKFMVFCHAVKTQLPEVADNVAEEKE